MLSKRRRHTNENTIFSMPKSLEAKLKKEYPGNPHAVYGTLNKLGLMHGDKETKKGKRAESAHERALKSK